MERHAEAEKRMDFRFGVLASVIAAGHGVKSSPDKYFPSLKERPRTTTKPMDPLTAQAKAEKLRAWLQHRGLGG